MYNRRDAIGHWVAKRQPTDRHCQHACCRGYREHPEHWPVILPKRRLRSASEDALAEHFRRISWSEDPKARASELQILHEWDRRAKAEEREGDRQRTRELRREAIATNRAAARQEREAEYERIKLDAEARTQGYLTNAAGRARGIADHEILTGRRDVFNRYASDEAKDYFRAHPRPTASYFRGQDTRIHAQAEGRRRQMARR